MYVKVYALQRQQLHDEHPTIQNTFKLFALLCMFPGVVAMTAAEIKAIVLVVVVVVVVAMTHSVADLVCSLTCLARQVLKYNRNHTCGHLYL